MAALTLANLAHADALADIKSRGTLVCGTQNASEPYAFPDAATRQIAGFDVDVCRALAQGLGVKLEHRALSTDASACARFAKVRAAIIPAATFRAHMSFLLCMKRVQRLTAYPTVGVSS